MTRSGKCAGMYPYVRDSIEHKFSIEVVRPIEEHAKQIMDWRNDPTTLLNSFHHDPKVWDQFWIEFRNDYFKDETLPPVFILRSNRRVVFMSFRNVEHPLKDDRCCCDISINVDPSMRGQGLGVVALKMAVEFLKSRGVQDIVAEIRIENRASVVLFEKAGYLLLDQIIKKVPDTGESCTIYRYLLKGI